MNGLRVVSVSSRLPFILFCLFGAFSLSLAGEMRANPPLLTSTSLPPPRANPDSNKVPQPALEAQAEEAEAATEDVATAETPSRKPARSGWVWARRGRTRADEAPPPPPVEEPGVEESAAGEPAAEDAPADLYQEPPTPAGVETYRLRLEDRLMERYNNLPEFAGRVAKVSVVLSRPLDVSLDGTLIRAEFDQLVYDNWGRRLPDLEKEYYVVTFGSGGAQQVRSDPSVRVGLDLEKTYSERLPLAADPFRNVESGEAFKPTPTAKMPEWWRPEFPELR